MFLPQVRAVLFDAVGTLMRPDPSVAKIYAAVGRRFGSCHSEATVADRFRAAFARQEQLDSQEYLGRTSEERERSRWQSIVSEVFGPSGETGIDTTAIFACLWRHFAESRNWRLFGDVAACWNELQSQGLVLGLASNFDGRLEPICRGLPPMDRSQHIFVSSQLGHRKPRAEFFRAIETRLGMRPEQILLVGDDLENDYAAALAAGWRALLIDRTGLPAANTTIQSLEQVPGLL